MYAWADADAVSSLLDPAREGATIHHESDADDLADLAAFRSRGHASGG